MLVSEALGLKGVLLTGGTGSRLKPYTEFINKHLLSVAGLPMVEYPIRSLWSAGVGTDEIAIIYNDPRIMYLSTYHAAKFTYIHQDKPSGIAQATYLAKDFVGDEPFMVMCGDNYFVDALVPTKPPQVWASEIPDRGLTILGAYYFDKRFFEIFPETKKSARGEYEMASVINRYGSVEITQVEPERWVDMGTLEGIALASKMIRERQT
jgi:glucose-1-phosphate thymidylyltransferase